MAQALIDVDDIYGYFSPLRPYRYDCTGSESSLQSCTYSYYSGCNSLTVDSAGVRCTNSLGILETPSNTSTIIRYCPFCNVQGVTVPVANCTWLEGKQAMKEDWSIAIKASGPHFVIWMMKKPQWLVNSLDLQYTPVSAAFTKSHNINCNNAVDLYTCSTILYYCDNSVVHGRN